MVYFINFLAIQLRLIILTLMILFCFL